MRRLPQLLVTEHLEAVSPCTRWGSGVVCSLCAVLLGLLMAAMLCHAEPMPCLMQCIMPRPMATCPNPMSCLPCPALPIHAHAMPCNAMQGWHGALRLLGLTKDGRSDRGAVLLVGAAALHASRTCCLAPQLLCCLPGLLLTCNLRLASVHAAETSRQRSSSWAFTAPCSIL